jgi:hypothetical protein
MTIQKRAGLARKIRFLKVCHLLAVSAVALGAVLSVAPVRAATVSYNVAFSIQGIYDSGNWYGNGTAIGSFDITYDPNLAGVGGYPNQSLTGVISNLTATVTVPALGGVVSLDPITSFTFNYGTLTLYSDYTTDQNKNFTTVPDLVIGINGLPVLPPSGESAAGDVWFSLATDTYTETGSGTATFTAETATPTSNTPLPATLPLFASGLGVVGLLARRWKKKAAALAA